MGAIHKQINSIHPFFSSAKTCGQVSAKNCGEEDPGIPLLLHVAADQLDFNYNLPWEKSQGIQHQAFFILPVCALLR